MSHSLQGRKSSLYRTILVCLRWQIHVLLVHKVRKEVHVRQNPSVTVEVERFTPDLSNFSFVAIPGRIEEVLDPEVKSNARQKFVELIKKKNLSSNVLSALGHKPDEPIEALLTEESNSVWKLTSVNVRDISGLKHSAGP